MTANIIKYEKIDMEMLDILSSQPEDVINSQLKKQLMTIQKNVITIPGNNVVLKVEYNYGSGKENLKFGRIYAKKGISLGSMSAILIRNPMTYKYYWDIDQICAHYYIANQYCLTNELPNKYISEYINNRDDILEKVMKQYEIERKSAKTLLIKIGYGGSILPEGFDESPHLPYNYVEDEFTKGLKKEMEILANHVYKSKVDIWGNYKRKNDTNILRQSGASKEFKMLSVFLQDIERQILMIMDKTFTELGRSVDILIHDGCMIRKLDENEPVENIISLFGRVESVIEETLNYKIKLSAKPIPTEFIPKKAICKYTTSSFWINHFVCDGKLYHEHRDYMKIPIAKDENYLLSFHEDLGIKNVKNMWKFVMANPIRKYTYMDWIPFGDDANKEDYNTFKSPKWVELFTEERITDGNEYFKLLDMVKNMTMSEEDILLWNNSKTLWQIESILCYDNDIEKRNYKIKYFMNYLGNMICKPNKRVEKMLFMRNKTGGCGKTSFMERAFAGPLLGRHLYELISKMDDVFGDKNNLISNKLFLIIEEVEVKEQKNYDAVMKSFITSKDIRKRKLYQDTENVKNYLNFYGSSNKNCPVMFDSKNMRRYPIIDCKEYKLSKEEQLELENESNNPIINKMLLKYILHHYEKDFNFEKFPEAESVKNMEKSFSDNITLFLKYMLNDYEYSTSFLRDESDYMIDALLSFTKPEKPGEWWIRSDPFFKLLEKFLIKYKGVRFESSIHQLRNSNDWLDFTMKYGKNGLGLFAIRDLNKKPHYVFKIEELKKYFPSLDEIEKDDTECVEESSSPKRQCNFDLRN